MKDEQGFLYSLCGFNARCCDDRAWVLMYVPYDCFAYWHRFARYSPARILVDGYDEWMYYPSPYKRCHQSFVGAA